MQHYMNKKFKILIVDDSEMNRELLSEILADQYEIETAENGEQALSILEQYADDYALMLLDIVMPEMDGFSVLEHMNKRHWIDNIPVIIISSETSSDCIRRAYDYGATDFISRPFDAYIVRRRVVNTITLYAKQRKMAAIIAEKVYENEKNTNLMVSILSHIVEFRNGESGPHILHITTMTGMLLRHLLRKTDKYQLTAADIPLISNAAALHDIGKISIPEGILNKPGRFTPEEYKIMQSHSRIGADMLHNLPLHQDEPLIKAAYQICRWHHERWDGRGYPDGLAGDEIPISAQVVALADVYDALTSERCYKTAFAHEKAIHMILNGECGTFNPILMECLKDMDTELEQMMHQEPTTAQAKHDVLVLQEVIQGTEELSTTSNAFQNLEIDKAKLRFLLEEMDDLFFSYQCDPPLLRLSSYGARWLGVEEVITYPLNSKEFIRVMEPDVWEQIMDVASKTTYDVPNFEFPATFYVQGTEYHCVLRCRTIWVSNPPRYCGIVGRAIVMEEN